MVSRPLPEPKELGNLLNRCDFTILSISGLTNEAWRHCRLRALEQALAVGGGTNRQGSEFSSALMPTRN
jgi:hypothetical protein